MFTTQFVCLAQKGVEWAKLDLDWIQITGQIHALWFTSLSPDVTSIHGRDWAIIAAAGRATLTTATVLT